MELTGFQEELQDIKGKITSVPGNIGVQLQVLKKGSPYN